MRSHILCIVFLCGLLFFSRSVFSHDDDEALSVATPGEQALATAEEMIGRPYKYKGDSPEGFDCSGLVRYSYLSAGLDLPHRTLELKQRAQLVRRRQLQKGDLLFFKERGRRYSHVGIYAGNNLFVHAASRRGEVRIDSLLDPYWRARFLDAGRPDR